MRSPSPDGAHLVWASRRALVEELWTGNANGENLLQLTHLEFLLGHAALVTRWQVDCF